MNGKLNRQLIVVIAIASSFVTALAGPAPAVNAAGPGQATDDEYRYQIQLENINYDVFVYVNGRQILYQNNGNRGLFEYKSPWWLDPDTGKKVGCRSTTSHTINLSPYLNDGANTIRIALGNIDWGGSSLDVTIYADGRITFPTRSYSQDVTGTGWQLEWLYTFDKVKGIKQLK
jgi:hypothetical protein